MLTKTNTAITPMSIGELAALYNVTRKTMNAWILPHSPKIGKLTCRFYTVRQVKRIYKLLGRPGEE